MPEIENARVLSFGWLQAGQLVKREGILAFWKGFGPATIKLAPHSVISFIILDNLTIWYTGKSAM